MLLLNPAKKFTIVLVVRLALTIRFRVVLVTAHRVITCTCVPAPFNMKLIDIVRRFLNVVILVVRVPIVGLTPIARCLLGVTKLIVVRVLPLLNRALHGRCMVTNPQSLLLSSMCNLCTVCRVNSVVASELMLLSTFSISVPSLEPIR